MQTREITKLFTRGGIELSPTYEESLTDLKSSTVIPLFEEYGVVLFRGFKPPEDITKFTNIYTESYAADSDERKPRSSFSVVREVNSGTHFIPLHSEAAFSPIWPEIIWFYCVTPSRSGGETILCDGVSVWKNLSTRDRKVFLANPIYYKNVVPKIPSMALERASLHFGSMGTSDLSQSNSSEPPEFIQIRFAVTEGRKFGEYCFCNYLLCTHRNLINISFKNVENTSVIDNIDSITEKLTYPHSWESGDLLMIDNRRFMHGRKAFDDNVRDILLIQTGRASFGFGATTRRSWNAP